MADEVHRDDKSKEEPKPSPKPPLEVTNGKVTGERLTDEMSGDEDAIRFLRHDITLAVDELVALGTGGLSVVRWLGETYYDHQLYRMESDARIREADKLKLPTTLLNWYSLQQSHVEKTVRSILDKYTKIENTGMGMWARNVVGIGPIISAMLLALIDMNVATNPSKIWRYFGLDPSVVWKKGEKRPWNATAKTLAWKIGDSFCKNHNKPNCFYGKLYEQEKARQIERNDAGLNSELAAAELERRAIRDVGLKATYQAGRIPDGRVELRARRKAVKVFLVHYWAEYWRRLHPGQEAPQVWVLAHGGHVDEIKDPQYKGVYQP